MTTRVLLAEDNEALSHMLVRFLAAQGYEVLSAKSGTDALRVLAAHEIGLLVLDLRLPEINGIEVLQRLRKTQRGQALPVIIMTGYYRGGKYAEAARALGVEHYLEKPFSQQAFLRAVESATAATPAKQSPPNMLLPLLVELHYGRQSGLLKLRQGPSVAVSQGVPYSFVSRGSRDFSAFLAARGRLTPEEQQLFVDSGEERLFLTQSGLLPYEDLVAESRQFLAKTLLDSLRVNAAAEFVPGGVEPELPLVPLLLPEFIYEAVAGHSLSFNADAFLSRYGHLYPGRTARFFRQSNFMAMRQEDIATLGLINGRRTLNEIVEQGVARNDATGFCHFLRLFRLIELHPAPAEEERADFPLKTLYNRPLEEEQAADEESEGFEDLVQEVSGSVELAVGSHGMAAPLSSAEISFEQQVQRDAAYIKDKNYYELFGLTPGSFSFNALKESYFTRTRPYAPERLMELSSATLETAQEVLSSFSTAYNTLSSVVSKERYDELLNAEKVGIDGKQDDKLQAQVQFQSGKVFLEMGEFANAEKALADAYRLEQENPLHAAYLAWAIYRNPANKGARTAQEKARTLLSRSLQSGKHAEAYSFRGWMLLDEGRDGLAEGELQKALKLNPRENLAHKGMQLIAERRQAEKKGLFRKIFG